MLADRSICRTSVQSLSARGSGRRSGIIGSVCTQDYVTKECGVGFMRLRWQPRSGTGFTGSMTRKLDPVTCPHKLAPHTFWYSLDSMATARPPLPRAVNFTDHLG